MTQWPLQTTAALTAFYGPAGGRDCTAGSCTLPFPFPLAWDQTQRLTRFACHIKVAPVFTRVFAAAAKHYGEKRFRELRLDQFGGCYNYRPMRGSTRLSTHAWGVAFDLDPLGNGLKVSAPQARFSAEAYLPFWRIVEAEGLVSLGRARNMDWMHVQAARL